MSDKFKTGLPHKVLCIYCGKDRKVNYCREIATTEYRGIEVKYAKILSYCSYCGWLIATPGLWDKNLNTIKEAYGEVISKRGQTDGTKFSSKV